MLFAKKQWFFIWLKSILVATFLISLISLIISLSPTNDVLQNAKRYSDALEKAYQTETNSSKNENREPNFFFIKTSKLSYQ